MPMSRFCLIVENRARHQLVISLARIYNYKLENPYFEGLYVIQRQGEVERKI